MATSTKMFQTAQQRRANYPLKSGEYKLKETLKQMQSYSEEIMKIAALKNNPQNPCYKHRLRHCVSVDCGSWLKGLPNAIADLMGYNVSPAIDALVGDGISSADAAKIKSEVVPRINELVWVCDRAQRVLIQGVSVEYDNFKRGDSILAELTEEAKSIVNTVLRKYESALPSMGK